MLFAIGKHFNKGGDLRIQMEGVCIMYANTVDNLCIVREVERE
jgi:hypothetical protein